MVYVVSEEYLVVELSLQNVVLFLLTGGIGVYITMRWAVVSVPCVMVVENVV